MKSQLYWIEGPWKGRLAIFARPRGGDWLEDEVRDWKNAGLDTLVSTLTADEVAELDLGSEEPLCRAQGLVHLLSCERSRRANVGSIDATAC